MSDTEAVAEYVARLIGEGGEYDRVGVPDKIAFGDESESGVLEVTWEESECMVRYSFTEQFVPWGSDEHDSDTDYVRHISHSVQRADEAILRRMLENDVDHPSITEEERESFEMKQELFD